MTFKATVVMLALAGFLFATALFVASPVYAAGSDGENAAAVEAAVAEDIVVEVNGLVCDFCAQAIEKVFGKKEAVHSVDVDLDNHRVVIDLNDGQDISDDELTGLITDAGYNVSKIVRAD